MHIQKQFKQEFSNMIDTLSALNSSDAKEFNCPGSKNRNANLCRQLKMGNHKYRKTRIRLVSPDERPCYIFLGPKKIVASFFYMSICFVKTNVFQKISNKVQIPKRKTSNGKLKFFQRHFNINVEESKSSTAVISYCICDIKKCAIPSNRSRTLLSRTTVKRTIVYKPYTWRSPKVDCRVASKYEISLILCVS